MTDLLTAAKRLGEARRGRAQTWLLSRYDAKTDNYATAVADEQWALEIALAEAEYEKAKREDAGPFLEALAALLFKAVPARGRNTDAVEPDAPSAHAHAEGDHCDQTA